MDIKSLFDQYSENGLMTVDHLHRFLTEVQKEEKTKEEAQVVLDQSLHEFRHLNIFHRKALNLEAFFKFLFSDNNPPISSSKEVHFELFGFWVNFGIFVLKFAQSVIRFTMI